jgi:hypothetical protein
VDKTIEVDMNDQALKHNKRKLLTPEVNTATITRIRHDAAASLAARA